MKLRIKYYPQYKSFSCGPVSLKMVFEHLGIKYTREKLIKLCESKPHKGTENESLITEIKREGLVFVEKANASIEDLVTSLENGYLPLVNYYSPLSKGGHYSVVNGYSKTDQLLYLADPAYGKDYCLSFKDFEQLWHNSDNTIKGWYVIVGREKISIPNDFTNTVN